SDSFYFEFFTTGNPVVTGLNSFSTQSAKAACVGVQVNLLMGGMSVQPKLNTGQRNYDGTKISLVARPFQVQLINEPVKFVPSDPPVVVLGNREKYPQALYESYAP